MFTLGAVLKAFWPIIGGGLVAILLGRWGYRFADISFAKILVATVGPARRTALSLGRMVERVDAMLQQWQVAVLSLLVLAILFGSALLAAR